MTETIDATAPFPPYFVIDGDNSAIPLDPITQERLQPHTIPESLSADPDLQRGYNYLRDNAHRIHFRLLLSGHGNADDLAAAGIDLEQEARELAGNNGVLFVEHVSTHKGTKQAQADLNAASHAREDSVATARQLATAQFGKQSFFGEKLRQLAGTGVEVVHPDFTTDSSSPVDQALTAWDDALEETMDQLKGITNQTEYTRLLDKWHSSNIGFNAYRNWYLIGKMGAYLADQGKPGDIHASLLVGGLHHAIGEEIGLFGAGADVEYVGLQEEGMTPSLQVIRRAIGAAALSFSGRITLAHSP